jgi:hypothetical protein
VILFQIFIITSPPPPPPPPNPHFKTKEIFLIFKPDLNFYPFLKIFYSETTGKFTLAMYFYLGQE